MAISEEALPDPGDATALRADLLFHDHRRRVFCHTDRVFAGLMAVQWLAGILAACWISPRAWAGVASQIHVHV